MIGADLVVRSLRDAGVRLFTGVPCSYLTPLINTVIDDETVEYVGAANEGDAVAIACGAELGGMHSAVMFQNSGFGNAVNPLTSLAATFEVPVLIIATWRGHPGEPADEPQHQLMGRITPALFELLGIPWEVFPTEQRELQPTLCRALTHLRTARTPFALIMRRSSLSARPLRARPTLDRCHELPTMPPGRAGVTRLTQDAALRVIQDTARDTDVILATTGYTGRALFALGDRPNQLYMAGSMGCVSSLGLGLAIAQPHRRIVVLDGDGALLMRMGAMAVLGYEHPPNLLHVLLDNAVHDSTGAQATVAPDIDFASLARACGYPTAERIDGLDDLARLVAAQPARLTFAHVLTMPRDNRKLPRPDTPPPRVAARLQRWLGVPDWC